MDGKVCSRSTESFEWSTWYLKQGSLYTSFIGMESLCSYFDSN